MREPKLWLVVVALVVTAVACEHSAHHGSRDSAEVTLRFEDAGRSVTLHVGDRLSLRVGSSAQQHWVIASYSRSILSAPTEHGQGAMVFTALAGGHGQVAAINTFACPSATVHECSIPEFGGAATSPAGTLPPRFFTVKVRVK